MGIKYCTNCIHDLGSSPVYNSNGRKCWCSKGHNQLRNVPNGCEDFEGELYVKQKKKVNAPVYKVERNYSTPYRLTVYEIANTQNTDWQDHATETFRVEGFNLEDCFKKIYPSERSLRYCSGHRIQLADTELHKAYEKWKETGVTIEMYYGNATVD